MFNYIAYGLGIRSFLPLPELSVDDAHPDVIVRLGDAGFSPPEHSENVHYFSPTAEETQLFYRDAGSISVRNGREIVVDPIPRVEERLLRLFILGPALGVLLQQRGRLVLHASAVAVAGKAVLFLGRSGWGKSTTAAALYSRGHDMVADDVTAIQVDKDTGIPIVVSGFPQLKLWPEAAASSLGDVPETLPRVDSRVDKRARRVAQGFTQASMPVGRIYVLDEGERHEVELIEPQDALIELISHSYCIGLLGGASASSLHFLQCSSIVNNVTISRLKRHRSLSALSDLAQLVEEDLARSPEQGVLCADRPS